MPRFGELIAPLYLSITVASTFNQFETSDPMQWFSTSYANEAGANEVHLDIKFVSPCEFDGQSDWLPVYKIKNISYDHLMKLCHNKYVEILGTIDPVGECLPPNEIKPRRKRIVPLLYGANAITAAVGGVGVHKIYEGFQRLTDLESRNIRLKEASAYIQKLQREARQHRLEIISLNNRSVEMIENNKKAIIEQATITTEVAWSSSRLFARRQRWSQTHTESVWRALAKYGGITSSRSQNYIQ